MLLHCRDKRLVEFHASSLWLRRACHHSLGKPCGPLLCLLDGEVLAQIDRHRTAIGVLCAVERVLLWGDERTERDEATLDLCQHVLAHQSVALGRDRSRGIDHEARTVAQDCVDDDVERFYRTNQAHLDHLRLDIADHSLDLAADHGSGEIVELLDAEGVLHRDARDSRHGVAAQGRYGLHVGLHAREARAVGTRYRQYRAALFHACKGTHFT